MKKRFLLLMLFVYLCISSCGIGEPQIENDKTDTNPDRQDTADPSINDPCDDPKKPTGPEFIPPTGPHPILFVTQVPIKDDWANIASASNNHKPTVRHAPRGGDLMIAYPNGNVKNLTKSAGFGVDGLQTGDNAIAVRDPSVHFDGLRALFSMVKGAPGPSNGGPYYWQVYEITGLEEDEEPIITKVPGQPETYNNVDPIYGSNDQIIFASDRPRKDLEHIYPQLDEYNSIQTVTGLWSLNPTTGDLHMLNHTPSGAYDPSIDSFGRLLYIRFNHLTRDKLVDELKILGDQTGPLNYSSEAADATPLDSFEQYFPEPNRRWVTDWLPAHAEDLDFVNGYESNMHGHRMKRFLPWTMNQDGTEEQTLNHLGEHELGDIGNSGKFTNYTLNPSFKDDPNLRSITYPFNDPVQNQTAVRNVLQIREDPTSPGTYYAIDTRYHDTHASGKIIQINAPQGTNPADVTIDEITHPTTANPYAEKPEGHSGFYRNPLPLSDGRLIAVHAETHSKEANLPGDTFGTYDFQLVEMSDNGEHMSAGESLTGGIYKELITLDGSSEFSFAGYLWELDPVEVVRRPVPYSAASSVKDPELAALASAGTTCDTLTSFLKNNDLALIVIRDATSRDAQDVQQPFNLAIPNSNTQTLGAGGKIYQVSALQLLEAQLLRGYDGPAMYYESKGGRRSLPTPSSDPLNPQNADGPTGSIKISDDGSVAALVPARRAMTWQLLDPNGSPVVRERYWFTFQPGEIRTCTSCHEPNTVNQAGNMAPTNAPGALVELVEHLKANGHL